MKTLLREVSDEETTVAYDLDQLMMEDKLKTGSEEEDVDDDVGKEKEILRNIC